MKVPLQPIGISQGVAHAALAGPEELARVAGVDALVRLGSNESPFGPSPKALAAYQLEASGVSRYGDPSCALLREAIAAHHGVDRACVTVGAGIDDLLGWIVRAFVRPGGGTVAGLGAFPTFEMHAVGYGTDLTRVAYLAGGRTDLAGFVDAAERAGGALVFLPNPDNPSGSSYPWADVVSFVDALPDGSLVIHDEAYANFLDGPRRFPLDAIDSRMIRLRTFSKEYALAGLRVGYALAPPDTIAALDAVRLLYGVSRPAQVAATAALGDADFVHAVVRKVADGRDEYGALGSELGMPTLASATNFVLFDFGDAPRARAAVASLLERGIHVRKPSQPPLDRYIRVSVGSPPERAAFADALRLLFGRRHKRST
jgi:histidinol-phosphate aminotransferase